MIIWYLISGILSGFAVFVVIPGLIYSEIGILGYDKFFSKFLGGNDFSQIFIGVFYGLLGYLIVYLLNTSSNRNLLALSFALGIFLSYIAFIVIAFTSISGLGF